MAALKITKCNLLTWSQLCLSPSHSKHSPTLLTLSQCRRRPPNTKADEAWLIEKGNLNSSTTTRSPGCAVIGSILLDKQCGPSLSFCFHSPECTDPSYELAHLLWRQVYHKTPWTLPVWTIQIRGRTPYTEAGCLGKWLQKNVNWPAWCRPSLSTPSLNFLFFSAHSETVHTVWGHYLILRWDNCQKCVCNVLVLS